jgi:hypothetical protein
MPNTIVVWREWLKFSIDLCIRQSEEPYRVQSFSRSATANAPRTPSRKGKEKAGMDSELPVETSPPTPDKPSISDWAGPTMDPLDFDDVDAELEEFMGSDDEDEEESMDGSESGKSESRWVSLSWT